MLWIDQIWYDFSSVYAWIIPSEHDLVYEVRDHHSTSKSDHRSQSVCFLFCCCCCYLNNIIFTVQSTWYIRQQNCKCLLILMYEFKIKSPWRKNVHLTKGWKKNVPEFKIFSLLNWREVEGILFSLQTRGEGRASISVPSPWSTNKIFSKLFLQCTDLPIKSWYLLPLPDNGYTNGSQSKI